MNLPLGIHLILTVTVLSIFPSMARDHEHDLVILNGRVIDPESGLDAVRHVGIRDGTVVSLSEFALEGDSTVDASGMIVSPGFIDIHAHGQNIGDYRMQAMQGVTTMLELESGVLPISGWYETQGKKKLPINYGASAAWTFGRVATFTGKEPESDAAWFQEALREKSWQQEIATDEQLEKILTYVREGLDEGALGIGINGGYAPAYGQKEYYSLAKLAAERDVATYTHVRYMSVIEPGSAFEAVTELIALSAVTGAHMHLCHVNSNSTRQIRSIMPLIEEAKKRGLRVTVEAYPWGAASTFVGAAMFRGPKWRERAGDTTAHDFQLGGDRLEEKEFVRLQADEPGTFINWHFLDESVREDLSLLDVSITHPDVMIASDSMLWMTREGDKFENYAGDAWPLPKEAFSHPRSNGTFAKILRSYVRERGLMSFSEAIRKMSLMPAQTLEDFVPQMEKKGRLQIGMDADIAVFDPETVADVGTYEDSNRHAKGVQFVLVNGTLIVKDGKLLTDAAPGKAIRREVVK